MLQLPQASVLVLEHFKHLEDPRAEHLVEHRLLDIIALSICAVICGADSWVDIENYSRAKAEWLRGLLDVAFNEDASCIRKDHAPESLALIRHVALNLLRQDTSAKGGIKARRLKAGWDNAYLSRILAT
ncbi:MAG: transposase family protein [Cyanobacteriota bacterium]